MKYIRALKVSSVGSGNCPSQGNWVSFGIVFCRPHKYNLYYIYIMNRRNVHLNRKLHLVSELSSVDLINGIYYGVGTVCCRPHK